MKPNPGSDSNLFFNPSCELHAVNKHCQEVCLCVCVCIAWQINDVTEENMHEKSGITNMCTHPHSNFNDWLGQKSWKTSAQHVCTQWIYIKARQMHSSKQANTLACDYELPLSMTVILSVSVGTCIYTGKAKHREPWVLDCVNITVLPLNSIHAYFKNTLKSLFTNTHYTQGETGWI